MEGSQKDALGGGGGAEVAPTGAREEPTKSKG